MRIHPDSHIESNIQVQRFIGIDGDWKEARHRGRPGGNPFADMCMCMHGRV